jgi:hypothetical protein
MPTTTSRRIGAPFSGHAREFWGRRSARFIAMLMLDCREVRSTCLYDLRTILSFA